VKSNETESAATDSRPGQESGTENSSTSLPASTADQTPQTIRFGDVAIATNESSTPDRSSRLSAADALKAIEQILRTEAWYDSTIERIVAVLSNYDKSARLSAADEQRLYRIRKDRANKFMVSVTDVDFLLELLERLSR
jgi:hypothetical protein